MIPNLYMRIKKKKSKDSSQYPESSEWVLSLRISTAALRIQSVYHTKIGT